MALSRATVRILQLVLLAVLIAPSVAAENFRGETLAPVTISGPDEIRYQLEAGQVILVLPDREYPFVAGVEIVVEPLGSIGQDYALSVFGSVDPPSEEGLNNLAGVELRSTVLTATGRTILAVPYAGASDLSTSPGAIITPPTDPATGAIAIQLVPIMKGMSSGSLIRGISVRLRPILRPLGGIRVRLDGIPEVVARASDMITLEIDGRSIAPDELTELPPGIYRLRAFAGDLIDYTGNVGIELGRIEEIALLVQEPQALVHFAVPTVAEIFFDGQRIGGSSITVPPGTYTVLIRLGDFSVSRQVALDGDGTYRIGLDLDILVNRD